MLSFNKNKNRYDKISMFKNNSFMEFMKVLVKNRLTTFKFKIKSYLISQYPF